MALRLLEALHIPARWVDNHAGHVWVEAQLDRWVHLDPCEAAVDVAWTLGSSAGAQEPLLYAEGWGRCPSHVLAYEARGDTVVVTDVTSSYRPESAGPVPEEVSQKVRAAIQQATEELASRSRP